MAWVYILRCSDQSLYVGVTTDLAARLEQHHSGTAASYTSRRRPVVLVYSELIPNTADALARERQLKRWSAQKKRALIAGELDLLHRLARRRSPCNGALVNYHSTHMGAPLYELALEAKQDPIADAKLAFEGAVFHFGKLEALVATASTDVATLNQIHWHVRGFFWELCAVQDCLQTAKGPAHADLRRYAESASGEPWIEQVRTYRNHLHQSVYMLEIAKGGDKMTGLQLQPLTATSADAGSPPAGECLELLNWYLTNARRFLDGAPGSHGRLTRRD